MNQQLMFNMMFLIFGAIGALGTLYSVVGDLKKKLNLGHIEIIFRLVLTGNR